MKFSQKGAQNTHKRTNHSEELPFKCSLCSQRFKTKPLLQYHETLDHSTDGKHQAFQCYQCSASFRYENKLDNSTELWNHDSTHSEEYT